MLDCGSDTFPWMRGILQFPEGALRAGMRAGGSGVSSWSPRLRVCSRPPGRFRSGLPSSGDCQCCLTITVGKAAARAAKGELGRTRPGEPGFRARLHRKPRPRWETPDNVVPARRTTASQDATDRRASLDEFRWGSLPPNWVAVWISPVHEPQPTLSARGTRRWLGRDPANSARRG
jgi:hypothetical protein